MENPQNPSTSSRPGLGAPKKLSHYASNAPGQLQAGCLGATTSPGCLRFPRRHVGVHPRRGCPRLHIQRCHPHRRGCPAVTPSVPQTPSLAWKLSAHLAPSTIRATFSPSTKQTLPCNCSRIRLNARRHHSRTPPSSAQLHSSRARLRTPSDQIVDEPLLGPLKHHSRCVPLLVLLEILMDS